MPQTTIHGRIRRGERSSPTSASAPERDTERALPEKVEVDAAPKGTT
jgi:hypothetical protein